MLFPHVKTAANVLKWEAKRAITSKGMFVLELIRTLRLLRYSECLETRNVKTIKIIKQMF